MRERPATDSKPANAPEGEGRQQQHNRRVKHERAQYELSLEEWKRVENAAACARS
jgi:hypothetical protein